MSTEELMRLAAEFQELREEAQRALVEELRFRGLTESEITGRVTRSWLDGMDEELTQTLGNVRSVNGTGRTFYGKWNRVIDVDLGFEEFDTTLWLTLFFIPIYKLGRFRIRRRLVKGLSPTESEYSFVVVSRLDR
jgi:hypothetical protein